VNFSMDDATSPRRPCWDLTAPAAYWTQLGNLLLERGSFDQVVLAPVSMSGSEVSRWGTGGDLNAIMTDTASNLSCDLGAR
jgi:hypothetical protein